MQNTTTQLTVLSVYLVVRIIFVVPSLIKIVDARIIATSVSPGNPFLIELKDEKSQSHFVVAPKLLEGSELDILWETAWSGFLNIGEEKGAVIANVSGLGEITFSFSNHYSGRNTCDVEHTDKVEQDVP